MSDTPTQRLIVELPEPDATYLRTYLGDTYPRLLRAMRDEATRHNNHTQRYGQIEHEANEVAGDIADLLTGGTIRWETGQ